MIAGEEDEAYEEPLEGTEKALANLWKQVLNTERVGRGDDFFEKGGHSLKATVLMTRINREFGLNLSLKSIFHNPVLAKLSKVIDNEKQADAPAIPTAPDIPNT